MVMIDTSTVEVEEHREALALASESSFGEGVRFEIPRSLAIESISRVMTFHRNLSLTSIRRKYTNNECFVVCLPGSGYE